MDILLGLITPHACCPTGPIKNINISSESPIPSHHIIHFIIIKLSKIHNYTPCNLKVFSFIMGESHMTQKVVIIPSSSLTRPSTNTVLQTPAGAYYQPSTTTSIKMTSTVSFQSSRTCRVYTATVPCAGTSSCITHFSLSFDDLQVLDRDTFFVPDPEAVNGFKNVIANGDNDAKAPVGVQEITVVLEANIPSSSNGLIIGDISVLVDEFWTDWTGCYIALWLFGLIKRRWKTLDELRKVMYFRLRATVFRYKHSI